MLLFFNTKAIAAPDSEPIFFVSWQASSYAPAEFSGKRLPSIGTPIAASLEALGGGRVMDISREIIYWYLGDDLIESGVGAQKIFFRPTSGGIKKLRVVVGGGSGSPDVSVSIPVVNPEAVIVAPTTNGKFGDQKIRILAKPYFFNVSSLENLRFTWRVNNQQPNDLKDPGLLDISLGKDVANNSFLNIVLGIENSSNPDEAATKIMSLVFVK